MMCVSRMFRQEGPKFCHFMLFLFTLEVRGAVPIFLRISVPSIQSGPQQAARETPCPWRYVSRPTMIRPPSWGSDSLSPLLDQCMHMTMAAIISIR